MKGERIYLQERLPFQLIFRTDLVIDPLSAKQTTSSSTFSLIILENAIIYNFLPTLDLRPSQPCDS